MAQHYKFIMPVLIALLGSAWIFHSLKTGKNENQNTSNQHIATSSARNTDNNVLVNQLQQQILALQNENRELLQQLRTQPPSHTFIQSEQQTSVSNETNQLLQDKLDALEMEQQLRKANDFGNWIMRSQSTNGQFNLNEELAHRFEQETRDPIWAEQEENRYQQLFRTQDEFREFALRDTQCRNTQCEVTVSTANPEQSHQLLQAINNTLQGAEVLVVTDEQSGISKLYIGSKGFEFN